MRKFNTNGNDINWDEVLNLNNYVEDLELGIFNGDIVLEADGRVSDFDWEGIHDSNPTIVYYKAEQDINIQQLLNNRDTIDNHVDWYIVHDTNGNHVTLIGNVPHEYLTEDFVENYYSLDE